MAYNTRVYVTGKCRKTKQGGTMKHLVEVNKKITVAIWHRKPTTETRYEVLTSFGFWAILRVSVSLFISEAATPLG